MMGRLQVRSGDVVEPVGLEDIDEFDTAMVQAFPTML